MSENNGSKFQLIIAALILGYGLLSLTNSLLGGLLLIAGSIALFPKIRDLIIGKNEKLSKNKLLIFSIITIFLGGVLVSIGKFHKKRMFLKENPEVAAKLENREENRKKAATDTKIKNDLIAVCDLAIKKQLKNPDSYHRDYSSIEYTNVNDNPVVSYDYRAENSYGATTTNSVKCSIDKNLEFDIQIQ